jgi:Leucine-rich repeat (LRR) protein
MKPTFIALLAVLLCLPAVGADKKPLTKKESAKVIEAAIRKAAEKPTGELTKADLEKVTKLEVYHKRLTDVRGLEKLTQLDELDFEGNELNSLEGLVGLKQLRSLRLSDNGAVGLPKGLEGLTQLTWLILGSIHLTEVPLELGKLTQLEHLYLGSNQLTDVSFPNSSGTSVKWIDPKISHVN